MNNSYQPIIDMQFNGLHWIEASAGTGKTYTLSSLMVRILLEKYLPKQVIATTFTRKAAAELKSRIRLRLLDTLKVFESCRDLTQDQVLQKAQSESDVLYQVLLNGFAGRISYACERLKLVIDQLEELFVGTLDSFSQKLLREFAFESGKIERTQITDDAKKYSIQLIHDVLREWIQAQPQAVIDYLLLNKKIKSQDAYVGLVEKSLNFASAYFQEIQSPTLDINSFLTEVHRFTQLDLSQIESLSPYYSAAGEYYGVVAKKWRDEDKLARTLTQLLPELINAISQDGAEAIFASHFQVHIKQLNDLQKKVLNKCSTEILEGFEQHPIIRAVVEFSQSLEQLSAKLDDVDSYLQFYLAQEVKKRLPEVLQQKGETTFAQQIRTLAEALDGQQGQNFARYVHARYPLILVDEFQDTNQDQDDMLAQIWRHPERVQQGCMIMVGDRKQAIYGFRGGDMLTFLKAHQDVFGKSGHLYQLIHNHRSVQPLVEVVDALFQQQKDFGEQVEYTPVSAGSRPHPALVDSNGSNILPLRWIQVEDKDDEIQQVAWKIRDLLNQSARGQLYFQNANDQYVVTEEDIAVLSRNNPDLEKIHSALMQLGVRVNRPSRKSVFESGIARDVGALLNAVLDPFDESKIKRALLSRLMGFNLQKLIQLELQADGLGRYISIFDEIRELWQSQGFLTAWHYCLNEFDIWRHVVEQFSYDNERDVVNLRHLSELLSQYSEEYSGIHSLYHWYMKQLTSPLEREWEIERQLSNQEGIQLLTIHQSKGLEFKIVFLFGADRKLSDQSELNFSIQTIPDQGTGQVIQQRVVAVKHAKHLDPEQIQQHDERALAEHRRLWYVALTRAQHRVYAMMSDQKAQSIYGLAFWRGHGESQFQHVHSGDEPKLFESPPQIQLKQASTTYALDALPFPEQRFYARSKTSFSYLAQHLKRQQIQDDLTANAQRIEQASDELNDLRFLNSYVDLNPNQNQPDLAWIKANFPMGTFAGNFLHEIFEHIDFQDQTHWTLEIRRRFKNTYPSLWQDLMDKFESNFPENTEAEQHVLEMMAEWLNDVLTTPIQTDFCLQLLNSEARLAEFPFYLALQDRVFGIHRIQQLFEEQGIQMPAFNEAQAARYLNGSIDLVFFDGHQYHIADYKSNFLGKNLEDYSTLAIEDSMTHASYWLQAALYLVALHRYLTVNLQDYDIEKDLGGATYLYLRGMNGNSHYGFKFWRPSSEFIQRLDAILGYFVEDKTDKIA